MRWLALSGLLFAVGCDSGGFATTSGNIGEHAFNEVLTVFHGGPFLVFWDQEVDCLDMAWVEKAYNDAQSPTGLSLVGLPFGWEDEPQQGTFSVAGDAAVNAYGMVNRDTVFELYRGQDGTVTIDEEGPARSDPLVGTFAVTFTDGSQLAGQFESEWCRNLRSN